MCSSLFIALYVQKRILILDEAIAYLHNRNPSIPPCSQSQVARVEHRLGLWMKVSYTMLNLAYLPVNLEKRRLCGKWACNVADNDKIIDIDEAKFEEETQDQKHGKSHKMSPVRCQRYVSQGFLWSQPVDGCVRISSE